MEHLWCVFFHLLLSSAFLQQFSGGSSVIWTPHEIHLKSPWLSSQQGPTLLGGLSLCITDGAYVTCTEVLMGKAKLDESHS